MDVRRRGKASKRQKFVTFLLFLLTTVATAATGDDAAAETRVVKANGRAILLKSGKHFYNEYHHQVWKGDKIQSIYIRYVAPGGKVLATRSSDFRSSQFTPHYTLDIKEEGALEKVVKRGGAYHLSCRKVPGAAPKTKTLRVNKKPVIVGQGMNALVVNRWQALRKNQTVFFYLVVPSRFDYYRFKMKKIGEVNIRGEAATRFRMGLAGVLGVVLPGAEFAYGNTTKRLLRYRGPAAVKGGFKERPDIRVDFNYR